MPERETRISMMRFSFKVHSLDYMIYVKRDDIRVNRVNIDWSGYVDRYRHALALLTEASDLMETIGDTLIAAHIATPLAMVEDSLHPPGDVAKQDRPLRE